MSAYELTAEPWEPVVPDEISWADLIDDDETEVAE